MATSKLERKEVKFLADYNIQAVQRALSVLKVFLNNNSEEMSLTEISAQIGLTKSTTLRLLTTLQNEDFIAYDSDRKKYSLGIMLVRLGMAKYEKMDWRDIAIRHLQILASNTGLICYLSVRERYNIVYLAKIFPKQVPTWAQLMVQSGAASPLYSTGMGRLFLSHFSDEKLNEYLQQVPRSKITERTIVEEEELRKELLEIRETGIAINDCENEDFISSICAPLLNKKGEMVAAFSVAGMREMVLGERKELLLAEARRVAREITAEIMPYV